MTDNSYVVGTMLRLWANFRWVMEDSPVNPTAVLIKVKDPEETIITYSYALGQVTKYDDGSYYVDVEVTDLTGTNGERRWSYRGEGDGVGKGADERHFYALTTEFGT